MHLVETTLGTEEREREREIEGERERKGQRGVRQKALFSLKPDTSIPMLCFKLDMVNNSHFTFSYECYLINVRLFKMCTCTKKTTKIYY